LRFATRAVLVVALAGLVWVVACAAGYRTTTTNGHEKVFRVDKDGNKTLVYEVAKDGTLTVHDKDDPRSQELLAAKAHEKQMSALEEERIARIKEAPKRAANDPIRVVIHGMEIEERLSQAQHTEGAIEEQFRKEFEADGIIRVVSPVASRGAEITQIFAALRGEAPAQAASANPASDVEVFTRAYVEERAGYNKATKKLGKMAALVYEATIKSNYLPAELTVTEEGNVFRNDEVTKRFADKVKNVIKHQIGPTIPADRKL
jgi:hypothetical protein